MKTSEGGFILEGLMWILLLLIAIPWAIALGILTDSFNW